MSEEKKFTIEEVNAFREEVYRILISWGESEDFARGVASQKHIHQSMQYNTPLEYAELMCM